MKRAVRLVDVANEAGVTTSVVSRVLNGDPTLTIRGETRERIVRVAAALDYRPNGFARGLKLAKTMTIGLVINLGYSENAELIAAVERGAAAHGYLTLLADASEFVGRGENFRRLLLERRVDGLLVATGLADDEFIRELWQHELPVVAVNRRLRGVGPSTSVDDERGMRIAIEHLLKLGHTRIGYVGGPRTTDIGRRRLAGFRAAMRAAGLQVPARLVIESSEHEPGGFDAMRQLLASGAAPTAVAVWSVTTAVGALAAAREARLAIPDDLSVVAFHDAPIADYLEPSLATVRMPMAEMAKVAVELVLKLAAGQAAAETIVTKPDPVLVRRRSTARLRAQVARLS